MEAESSSETTVPLYRTARHIIESTLIFKWYFSTLFSQEIPCIVGNPNVHCCIGNSARPVPNLSHINPINTNPIPVRSILIFFSRLSTGELSYLPPLGSENIAAPYFKQCFFQWGVLPPRQSNTTPPHSQDRNNKYFILYIEFCINNNI